MSGRPLYPLRFGPIYQYRVWGGRRLSGVLSTPLPADDPIGEAWILSDRDDHASRVAEGALEGSTIRQLMRHSPEQLLGRLAGRFDRFPLLLKFLDADKMVSVQVHPSDQRTAYIPEGESGKTEAWVVLKAGREGRIYAGLRPGASEDVLRKAVANKTIVNHLASFAPAAGDAVFLPAGTVHTLGDVVVFEVQENSDVTFRLYDWDRDDPRTGKPRPLQVDQALACIDFDQGEVGPVEPIVEATSPAVRERLFQCPQFNVWRIRSASSFEVGANDLPRVLVGIGGTGRLEHLGRSYDVGEGDVYLLPAVVGPCSVHPHTDVTALEIALPE